MAGYDPATAAYTFSPHHRPIGLYNTSLFYGISPTYVIYNWSCNGNIADEDISWLGLSSCVILRTSENQMEEDPIMWL